MFDSECKSAETRIKPLVSHNSTRAAVINITWPVFMELLLSSLFSMVDLMMLGRIKDPAIASASIAAVGMTNQFFFVGLSLVQALNVGGTAMVARYYGMNQTLKIESTLKHVLLLSLFLLAIPFAGIGICFSDMFLRFFGAQADTVQVGRAYFQIVMFGFIFLSVNSSITAALRGIGETRVPMQINLLTNFLNVIGNALLIYGLFGFPQLGVTGAGLSTTLSRLVATILLLAYVAKGESVVKLKLHNRFRLNRDIIYNLIKIGVPATLEQMVLRVGLLTFTRIVAGLGTVIYAAHQISLSILSLSFQPGQAFSIAASSLVGMSLGSNELTQAEDYAKETRKLGSLIAVLMASIFFFFGPQIVGLYSTDERIITNAALALKIIALVQPFQASQLILAGGLRGAGDTVWPLVSTFFGVLLVRVVLAHILVNMCGYGLAGAWAAVFVDQLVRWMFVYLRFRSGHWKFIKIR